MNLESIQSELQKAGLDGWLFFDHHERDPLAYRVLGLKPPATSAGAGIISSRRGANRAGLVHQVEPHVLDILARRKIPLRPLAGAGDRVAAASAGREEGRHAVFAPLRRALCRQRGRGHGGTDPQPRRGGGQFGRVDPDLRGEVDTRPVGDAPRSRPAGGPDPARRRSSIIKQATCAGQAAGRIRRAAVRHAAVPGVRPGHQLGAHRGRQRERRGLALFACRRRAAPPSVAATWCCWTCGRSSISRTRSITTSPGWRFAARRCPQPMRKAFAVVVGARDAGIQLVQEAVAAGRTLRGFEVDDAVAGYIAVLRLRRNTSDTGPAIPSGAKCMASARTWTTWRRTTNGPSFRGPVSPSNRRSTCRTSASARRSTSSSRNAARA